MSYSSLAFVLVVVMKFTLDMLSPFREFNFIVENFAFIILIFFLIFSGVMVSVSKSVLYCTVLYLLLCSLWFALSEDVLFYLRFVSVVPMCYLISSYVKSMSIRDIEIASDCILWAFLFIAILNLLVSYFYYNPAEREFFNFEHANLLGSYILLCLPLVYLRVYIGGRVRIYKLIIVVLSFLSTSTGAFLLSLFVLFEFKRISALTISFSILGGGMVILVIYVSTATVFPELHTKIFSPIELIFSGKISELVEYSRSRIPIQSLGEEYQSSLIWRFYAYIVFSDYAFDRSFFSIVFGSGFQSFKEVWHGVAPHNDFLLSLIDFGLVGFIVLVIVVFRLLFWSVSKEPVFFPIVIVLISRLFFENNIYSYYLFSSFLLVFIYVKCAVDKHALKR